MEARVMQRVCLLLLLTLCEGKSPLAVARQEDNGGDPVQMANVSSHFSGAPLEDNKVANGSAGSLAVASAGRSADLDTQDSIARHLIWPFDGASKVHPVRSDQTFLEDVFPRRAVMTGDKVLVRLNPGERFMTPDEVAKWIRDGGLTHFETMQNAHVLGVHRQPSGFVSRHKAAHIVRPTANPWFGFPRRHPPVVPQVQTSVTVIDLKARPGTSQGGHRGDIERAAPLSTPGGVHHTPDRGRTREKRPPLIAPAQPVDRTPSSTGLSSAAGLRPGLVRPESEDAVWTPKVRWEERAHPSASDGGQNGPLASTTEDPQDGDFEYVEYEEDVPTLPTAQESTDTRDSLVRRPVHGSQPSFGTRLTYPSRPPHSPPTEFWVTPVTTNPAVTSISTTSKPHGTILRRGSFVLHSPVDGMAVRGGSVALSESTGRSIHSGEERDDERDDSSEKRFKLTTVNLAYILIGSCTTVSVVCLAVVAVSLRCKSAVSRKRKIGRRLAEAVVAQHWNGSRLAHQHLRACQQSGQQQKVADSSSNHPGPPGSTCSSASTYKCCCGTWTLGAKNLDSKTSLSRRAPRRLPFGAASTLHCESLGKSCGRKGHQRGSSSEDDSLDSFADDCSSCSPRKRCTCVTAAVVHDWQNDPSRASTRRVQQSPLTSAGERRPKAPPPPPPKPKKVQCPKCDVDPVECLPLPPSACNYEQPNKNGLVFWSSSDERLI